MSDAAARSWRGSLLEDLSASPILEITEPRHGAVLPANAASPMIQWHSENAAAWLVRITAPHGRQIEALCRHPYWVPTQPEWQALRADSIGGELRIKVQPISGEYGRTLQTGSTTSVFIDPDPLDSPIAYLQMPVPFRTARKNPQRAMWRKGRIDQYDPPSIYLTGLPICANCHVFSANGSSWAIDMDIDGDKGSFLTAEIHPELALTRDQHHSWNQLKVNTPAPFNYGLFASLSPDGRYLFATVGETSLFVMIDRKDFSQLFFPVTGQIGVYDRFSDSFAVFPGTADPGWVHVGPRLSPDATTLVFSRAAVKQDYIDAVLSGRIRQESNDTEISVLNQRYPYQFDLYTLPFPNHEHKAPTPLTGASGDGMSHYFPRYSPDGRWLVFTRSPTGLVLQPQSKLCIIPEGGGTVHELAANTERMNSWHSWSPDSRWLVFSGKAEKAETELFLCRIYPDGTSAPAVRLHRFSKSDFACAVPEFLPPRATGLERIRLLIEQKPRGDSSDNIR